MDKHERRIVKSAIRFSNGVMICSNHHFNKTMLRKCSKFGYSPAEAFKAEQGFVDQDGVFLTKIEALKVAESAGQYQRKVGSRKTLLLASDIQLT